MAVTANQIIRAQEPGGLRSGLVIDNTHFYEGTLCFTVAASGHITDVIATTANAFAGIVRKEVDNTLTGHTAGGKAIEFYTRGCFLLTTSGASQAWVGDSIYAVDNYTVNATSTNQPRVGKCKEYVSATQIWVEIDDQAL